MSNIIVIPASNIRNVSKEPRVNVTTPRKGAAIRIAFNAPLIERCKLEKVSHLAIEHDTEKKHLKFRPCDGVFENMPAHKLQIEGKGPTKMLLMPHAALSFLPARPYKVYFLSVGFVIHYGDE